MAAEYLADTQDTALYTPVIFNASIPCSRGWVFHENSTGIFVLRGPASNSCNCFAHYQVTCNANIALPEGGTVTPIAIALTTNGEPRPGSKAIYTPAAVEEFGNVTSTAIIKVPKGCCFSLAVEAVPGSTDPTVTAAPVITVANANLTIAKIA